MDVPERIPLNDDRLNRITHTNDRLEDFAELLADDWAALAELMAYYETHWREDVENFPEAQYGVLSEDGVWNEMGRFYHSVKEIAAVSQRIVREYESGGGESAGA